MGKFVDLNLLVGEPLEIKGLDGEIYRIPSEIPTKFYIKLMAYQDKYSQSETAEEQLKLIRGMAMDILNLDTEKNVTEEHFDKYFDNVNIMRKLIEVMIEHMQGELDNPNSSSPQSE